MIISGYQYGVKSIWQTFPESVDMLREYVNLRMSASETAKKLADQFDRQVSANMCVSKARGLKIRFNSETKTNTFAKHGLGKARASRAALKTMLAPPQKKRPKTVFYFRADTAYPVADIPPEPVAIPISRRVQLLDLTFNSCRWPLGDPRDEDFAFCGADRVKPEDPSNAYCAAHARIGYTPRQTRKITDQHKQAMLAGKMRAKRQREASWSE